MVRLQSAKHQVYDFSGKALIYSVIISKLIYNINLLVESMPQVYQTYVTQIGNGYPGEFLQTSVRPEARKHVFAHWQRFNGHYKNAGSRNAWFGIPNLTGSIGESLVDTVSQEINRRSSTGKGV